MARPPGPRKPRRDFDAEPQYCGSGITPEQAKAILSLCKALEYCAALGHDDVALNALEADAAKHGPPTK